MGKLIPPKEAAKILGISLSGVTQAMLKGKIPYVRHTSITELDIDDVIHYRDTRDLTHHPRLKNK